MTEERAAPLSPQQMRAMTELLERSQLADVVGMQFGGKRDVYAALGWDRTITLKQYRQRYERGGIAGRIVDAYPDATWRQPPLMKAPKRSPFRLQFERLVETFDLWSTLHRLDVLTALGHYGVLMLGFSDASTIEALAQPVSRGAQLVYMQPYSEGTAKIAARVEAPNDPRFGLPEFYKITGKFANGRKRTLRVHWTRVLHVAENVLEDPVIGRPRLMRVWNDLDSMAKVTGGSAEMFWRGGYQGLHANVDLKAKNLTDTEWESFDEQFEEWEHNLRRVLQTRGIDVSTLDVKVADPTGAFEVQATTIAGSTGIPKRILFGSEMGKMASTQDRENWRERVEERRTSYVEDKVLKALLERLTETQTLPNPPRGGFQFEWPELRLVGPTERAQVAERFARAVKAFNEAIAVEGVDPKDMPITTKEFRKLILGMDRETGEGEDEGDE